MPTNTESKNIGENASSLGGTINLQAISATAITASATTYSPSTVFIGGTGNITVTTAAGESGVVFKNLPSGSFFPVLVTAVTAATATDLVLLR